MVGKQGIKEKIKKKAKIAAVAMGIAGTILYAPLSSMSQHQHYKQLATQMDSKITPEQFQGEILNYEGLLPPFKPSKNELIAIYEKAAETFAEKGDSYVMTIDLILKELGEGVYKETWSKLTHNGVSSGKLSADFASYAYEKAGLKDPKLLKKIQKMHLEEADKRVNRRDYGDLIEVEHYKKSGLKKADFEEKIKHLADVAIKEGSTSYASTVCYDADVKDKETFKKIIDASTEQIKNALDKEDSYVRVKREGWADYADHVPELISATEKIAKEIKYEGVLDKIKTLKKRNDSLAEKYGENW